MAGADSAASFAASAPSPRDPAWVDTLRVRLSAERTRILRLHQGGVSGTQVVRGLTAAVDRVVRDLFEASLRYAVAQGNHPPPMAVVALGGYGRRELAPSSDVDLLIVFDDVAGEDGPPDAVREVAEGVLYPLWDLGFELGQAVRSASDCVVAAQEEQQTQTAMLDSRHVSGDASLIARVMQGLRRQLSSPSGLRDFVDAKLRESEGRHRRYGDSVYYLEPNVKNGLGGLRDLQTALWVARVRFGTRELGELLQRGVINQREVREMRAARDFLHSVRVELHDRSGRRDDALTFDAQEAVTPALGFAGDGHIKPVEAFMRSYYSHTKAIWVHSRNLLARATTPRSNGGGIFTAPSHTRIDRDFVLFDGSVVAAGPEIFEQRPHNLVRIFTVAARRGCGVNPWTKDLIIAARDTVGEQLRADPEAAQAFLELLAHPDADQLVSELHELGILGLVLPEFRRITSQAQHDVFHVYTVDIHSLNAVQRARGLLRGDFESQEPRLHDVAQSLPPEAARVLLFGVLMHDVGKGKGRKHSERGARMCRVAGPRLGLSKDETRDVVWLVQWHLKMSHIAQRRDLEDMPMIRKFARLCRTRTRLDMLYLLTFADMSTTGPKVWNSWKSELIWRLREKTRVVLEADTGGLSEAEAVARGRGIAVEGLATLPGVTGEDIERFLQRMPDRYMRTVKRRFARRHFMLMRTLERHEADPRPDRRRFAVKAQNFPARGYTVLTVVCRDQPGLLAMLTGALAANGLDILSAEIFSTTDGVALDIFRVQLETRRSMADPAVRASLGADLQGLLAGELSVEALVETRRKRSQSSLVKPLPKVEASVEFDDEMSRDSTVMDVFAEDRLGLLYDVTRALAQAQVGIVLSRVHTEGNRAVDSFYLRNAEGAPLRPEARQALSARVLEAIGQG